MNSNFTLHHNHSEKKSSDSSFPKTITQKYPRVSLLKFIPLVIMIPFLFMGCSKDILKSYERRIIGQWHIRDVKRIGIGGSTDYLPFRDGTFVFNQDGSLTYRSAANQQFQGTWEITRRTINDQVTQSLQVTAIDFANEKCCQNIMMISTFAARIIL
jgi:hypothetical protein